jgi:tetratricopeptide (TPR) repeat protein
MSLRALVFAVCFAAATPALAQQPLPPDHPPVQKPDWVAPPENLPKPQRSDRTRNIEFLFGALKEAPDEASAKNVEDRIWSLWLASGSDTANLLMSRVKAAIDKQDFDLAIRLLDAIVELRPQYTEAWNRRATVFYMKKDFANSMADLRQVLIREPRHFGALSGLGMILQEIGDEKAALDAYRRALDVYPRLKGIGDRVKSLTEKVDGRDI